ncbi:uncharacterized protein LOC129566594 [Sitodiplosis mosellana]|uniref:uncharacterized protein LOC129566594 n=1 Tax=Sitodiplosis mosellana TaxID=263140 RepID=UPI00244521C4|nr:uncharacterized protein LOC129566594 [Sitodiplosis mosellana]
MRFVILLVLCFSACKGVHVDEFSFSNVLDIVYLIREGLMKTADHLIALECVNARNEENGQVFLHVCAEKGSLLCVKELLRNGADPNIKDNFNKRPVDYAKANEYVVITSKLTEAMLKSTAGDVAGQACRIDEADWKKMGRKSFGDLIDEVVGIGINKRFGAPFGDGGTLLHEWSKNNVTLGIEMLLEAGADPKIKDSNKKTALDHAVGKGYWKIAELLSNA